MTEVKEKPILIKIREKVESRLLEIVIVALFGLVYKMWDVGVQIAALPEKTAQISRVLNDTIKIKNAITFLNAKTDSLSLLKHEINYLKANAVRDSEDITNFYYEFQEYKNTHP